MLEAKLSFMLSLIIRDKAFRDLVAALPHHSYFCWQLDRGLGISLLLCQPCHTTIHYNDPKNDNENAVTHFSGVGDAAGCASLCFFPTRPCPRFPALVDSHIQNNHHWDDEIVIVESTIPQR